MRGGAQAWRGNRGVTRGQEKGQITEKSRPNTGWRQSPRESLQEKKRAELKIIAGGGKVKACARLLCIHLYSCAEAITRIEHKMRPSARNQGMDST